MSAEHMAEACRLSRVRGHLRALADILPGLLEMAGRPEVDLTVLAEVDADLAARIDDHRILAQASLAAVLDAALEQAARRPLPPMYVEPSKPATIDRSVQLRALDDLEQARPAVLCACGYGVAHRRVCQDGGPCSFCCDECALTCCEREAKG